VHFGIKWVDAIEHVTNHQDEVDAKWLKLYRFETGSTSDRFFPSQSLDKIKGTDGKENEPEALGKLAGAIRITRALTREVSVVCENSPAELMSFLLNFVLVEIQIIWDFYPAEPEIYVSLGSYFELIHGNRPGPTPSFKAEHIKNIRVVRKDLDVEATLGEDTVSLHNVCPTGRRP
jgi:hypothetical protein